MPREVHKIEKALTRQQGVRNKWAVAWAIYQKRREARLIKKYREKNK